MHTLLYVPDNQSWTNALVVMQGSSDFVVANHIDSFLFSLNKWQKLALN